MFQFSPLGIVANELGLSNSYYPSLMVVGTDFEVDLGWKVSKRQYWVGQRADTDIYVPVLQTGEVGDTAEAACLVSAGNFI